MCRTVGCQSRTVVYRLSFTTCVCGTKKRGSRKPLPKRCCCSRLIQWRRPPISSRRSSLSAENCLPSLSLPGLSDWLPSAARLPGLRASAGGSNFAAAAGDEARVGAVRAPRSSQLAWRLTPTFGCGKWPAAVTFSSTGGSGRSRRPAFRVRSSDYSSHTLTPPSFVWPV